MPHAACHMKRPNRFGQLLFQYHFRATRLCMNAAPPRAAKAKRGCAALLKTTPHRRRAGSRCFTDDDGDLHLLVVVFSTWRQMAERLPREGQKNATKSAHTVPSASARQHLDVKPRPAIRRSARWRAQIGVRNRTGFTARLVPVCRTPTEPNQAEGPVRFLSWVGQAHQRWGEGVPCPTPS